MSSWFPRWRRVDAARHQGLVAPDEALPPVQTLLMGIQHAVAMFGSTVLAPLLMGFDPNLAILMSGIGTLLFFVIVGGRVPSYLGSSFAFIGVVIAATGYAGSGGNPSIGLALGASSPAVRSTRSSAWWSWHWARAGSSTCCRRW
ncbi:solute carrier family 23 protein [Salinicola acroporae]|uniref:solute carrier family 23 protein n=1 Tax=Salinicola acroporae TaxID=1541440 RepID=UPI0024545E19|nr:solute carrier family 23 protein [Salinicola acroporae]